MRERRHVDVDHSELDVEIRLGEAPMESKAGVVDQHLDRPSELAQMRGESVALVPVSQVGGKVHAFNSVRSGELGARAFERLPVSRDEQQIMTIAGEEASH